MPEFDLAVSAEVSLHLSALADELLSRCVPGPVYGPDRARWEADVKANIIRIFRLAQASGWDKAVAATAPGPDTRTVSMADHLRGEHSKRYWPNQAQEADEAQLAVLHQQALDDPREAKS